MEQILSSLFFEVDLLRCQKLIPRDQLMRSSLRFTALDAYFVHKTGFVCFQYILQRHESSQTSASFHCHPGDPSAETRKERKWIFTGSWHVKGTGGTANIFSQLQNRVAIDRNPECFRKKVQSSKELEALLACKLTLDCVFM